VPFGWWADHHGQPATANSLTNDTLTDWGGGVAYGDTRVEVAPATCSDSTDLVDRR
jgi:anaerobic selenocysteine-containing dehydrogenase